MGLTQVNSGGIEDGSIVNADIKSDSAIALSKLASTPAVLTGSTNNTIATVTGANAIQGEANLTYDGDILSVGTGSGGAIVKVSGAEGGNAELWLQADEGDDNADNWLLYNDASDNKLKFASKTSGSYVDKLTIEPDGDLDVQGTIFYGPNNKGRIYTDNNWGTIFQADKASPNNAEFMWQNAGDTERLRIDNSGNLKINDGNLVIGTAGKGIDFSATSGPANGSGTSELLDDYEEGSWTPAYGTYGGATSGTVAYDTNAQNGFYVKIGCVVRAWFDFTITSWSGGQGTGPTIYGLPFTNNFLGSQPYYYSGLTIWTVSNAMSSSQSNFTGFIASGDTHFRTYASNTAQQSAVAPMNVTGRISGCIVYTTSS